MDPFLHIPGEMNETYHLLWCNDVYVENTWLSCSWGLVMVVLHKCDWRKGSSQME
ncbi:uncharacterized protein LOC141891509 isoform X3 [Acropora palmata]|uniref:uncharacterized protein LOC141891509 isoform X3 n=1 Tax=Acropora palmata TaxID=6131 RepID=UPI003DA1BDA5